MAIDYTKAFDSVDFGYIHKMLHVFNFGENFRKWISILYSGGTSCVTNNGFRSDFFSIERSVRQGDPISPLIFVLALEPLLHSIRKDRNIKGIEIKNNEIKLTGYADDISYFCNNKNSAINVITKINNFSKISGLEINKTKSECLILNYENLQHTETVDGIPIVNNLKILGHYFGKEKIICNYNNFFSKLAKMEKIFNIWKQRQLTLFGKTLIIKALVNSLYLFNSQVDFPPHEFIKEANTLCKSFLWNSGTAKIEHKAIINTPRNAGLGYPDLESTLKTLALKNIYDVDFENLKNSQAELVICLDLPIMTEA